MAEQKCDTVAFSRPGKGGTPRSEDRRLQTTFFGKESFLGLSGVDFLEKSVSKAATAEFRV